jgi:hypothetical protein
MEEKMTRQASIATLRRYSLIAWSVSLLLAAFGVVSLLLFLRPSFVGVDPGSASGYEGKPIWLVFGVLFVILGVVFQITTYRWPRHLLRVLGTQSAFPMRLRVEAEEDSEGTRYYARISNESALSARKCWRVGLWAPSRNTRDLIGRELSAMVYLDPKTAEPAVVEYADGYLWAMKGAVTPCPVSTLPDA